MQRTRFDDKLCPIARSVDLVGDWWTPLILRDACAGVRRFEDFQANLSIPRATLTSRLQRLVDAQMLRKEQYQQHPPRHEYRLTRKGAEFYPILAAMFQWGSDWLYPNEDGEPTTPDLRLIDAETGRELHPQVVDRHTGEPIDVRRTRLAVRE
ncbi:MAG TPA: transcriptional regulator [Acidimicrobiaceae bacterium]|nr:transcriptional regulator [Acidimicrobiaceae bacterium]